MGEKNDLIDFNLLAMKSALAIKLNLDQQLQSRVE